MKYSQVASILFTVVEKSKETIEELTCSELHDYIDSVCNSCFPDESPFEAIVIFLHTTIEVKYTDTNRNIKWFVYCRYSKYAESNVSSEGSPSTIVYREQR